MKTRLSALAAAVSSLSMLTACGGGGGGSGEVPEFTPAYVPSWTTAAGMWDGLMGSGRALSGVVTDGGESWLVYSSLSDPLKPAGFYYGSSSSVNGTFKTDSPNESEFNFENGGKRQGGLTAQYNITDGYSSANYLNGQLVALPPSGTVFALEMSATVYFPTAKGDLIMTGFTGTWDSVLNTGTWHGTTSIPGFATTLWYDQTFTMDEATGKGVLNALFNCGANTSSACLGFSGALQGDFRNTHGNGVTNPDGSLTDNASYKTRYAFTPADGLTLQWTLQTYKNTTDSNGDPITEYNPMPMTVTLHDLPPGNSITADTFTTNFNAVYSETPSISTIAGAYTASPAYTGMESVIRTDTTTFSISSDGVISGAESVSGCAYSGTVAPRRKGNVYNATAITFAGGSCPYTSSGTFTGVVTYNAGKLTLTAKNDAGDKGFLVIVKKP